MEVAKTFEREGIRYRPGDPLPEGLDRPTLEHYKRYGMVREVRTPGPAETRPAAPGKNTGAAPRKRQDPKPEVNKNAGGTGGGSDTGATGGKQPEDGQQAIGTGDGSDGGAVGGKQPEDGQQSAADGADKTAAGEDANGTAQKQD